MLAATMTLDEAFLDVVRRYPERVALLGEGYCLTYAALEAQVAQWAGALHGLGVRRGTRVADLLPPGWASVVLFLALARLGAVAVPLDPQLRRRQLETVLREVEPWALIAVEDGLAEGTPLLRSLLQEAAPSCPLITIPGAAAEMDPLQAGAPLLVCPEPGSAEDLAVILYTSGTTGRPKGVMHSHRGLISPVVASMRLRRVWLHSPSPAQLARMAGLVSRYGLRLLQAAGRPQTFLTAMGNHAIAGIEVMLQALLMGDRLILMPRFHPIEMLSWIERERVTVLVAAPLALSVLLRIRDLDRYDLSSLLICGTGSAPCPPELAREVQRRFGCAIHIGYGMTEIGGGISATSIEDSAERQAETVGRPMPGIEVRIVDGQRRTLPPGEVGELACRTESQMLGYYRAPELSRQMVAEDGWCYTGDLAVMDAQGYLRIVGRSKDVIIRGGQSIYPAEVEEFLNGQDGVREVAVVGVPGAAGDERVFAFIVAEEGAKPDAQGLMEHCRSVLEVYKVPDCICFVPALPRSSLGKVLKAELRALAAQEAEQSGNG